MKKIIATLCMLSLSISGILLLGCGDNSNKIIIPKRVVQFIPNKPFPIFLNFGSEGASAPKQKINVDGAKCTAVISDPLKPEKEITVEGLLMKGSSIIVQGSEVELTGNMEYESPDGKEWIIHIEKAKFSYEP